MEIQIVSGFLGTGKTTFLNKYLPLLSGLTAVVENEVGEVGVDGALLQGDIPVKELSSGCICCTLASDLQDGLVEIANRFQPERILIEPSGIGKLSDVVAACEKVKDKMDVQITKKIVLVDACDCAIFIEDFGQFYGNQIEYADIIFLSNVQEASEEELEDAKNCIFELNPHALVYEGDFRELQGEALMEILAKIQGDTEEQNTKNLSTDDTPYVTMEFSKRLFSNITLNDFDPMTETEIEELLEGLAQEEFGYVLRSKGIVPAVGGGNWHFDYTVSKRAYEKMDSVKEEINRIIVIGCKLNKRKIRNYLYRFGDRLLG